MRKFLEKIGFIRKIYPFPGLDNLEEAIWNNKVKSLEIALTRAYFLGGEDYAKTIWKALSQKNQKED